MRITREALLKLAKDTASLRAHSDRSLVCIYLTGSLLSSDPLLGGTTDIDLVFIHDGEPTVKREVSRLSNEIHLDVAHLPQSLFQQTRQLRLDPWIGSFLCQNPLLLHESHHWFEFTQASVCAQFGLPDYTMRRARPLAEEARQAWFDLQENDDGWEPAALNLYFKALEQATNAIACLSGAPLPERRFMLLFPQRAEAVGRPNLADSLVGLVLPQPVPDEDWPKHYDNWKKALAAAGALGNCPARLLPCRHLYYERGVNALHKEHAEVAAWWVVLRTWTLAACHLPPDSPARQDWQSLCQSLNLGAENFEERLEALDAYLDGVEETLDLWAKENGI